MTQIELALSGKTSPEMRLVAKREKVPLDFIRKAVAKGTIVIPKNSLHSIERPCGIGEELTTKVNANIGTSKDSSDIRHEIHKMEEALRFGCDTIMDLSTGHDIGRTRRAILKKARVPVGTVPIYEIAISGKSAFGSIRDIPYDFFFDILESQAKDGVDFFTIHAGVTRLVLDILCENPRILNMVSRGGVFLAEWMIGNGRENPFYSYFDRVIDIANRFDITLSLGDGLRPGSILDATDLAQITELVTLGELQKRALKKGVQVMIEGPGHVPINQVETNVMLEKSICNGAPFYVLGPLVTDIAPGYDHITAAIGGAVAAGAGADFLCYVTPSEHLRLPDIDDVKEGIVASKIAAHAGDVAKGIRGAIERDRAISVARNKRDWKKQFALALDKDKPMRYRRLSPPGSDDVCTMCGDYCSIKMGEKCFKKVMD
jgi:phosphomethylpyrimidine synthase